ncbi:MAG: peptidase M16 [SAR86 cluster bacterium]|uniref:Peptidase M16 n=1 Tax=SAR86 cluster bacterium TaxID=2030880 RepID=A0A2A5CCH6_9GAMM|nr:insulinase family protein [Gammaproteobacteria bacterium AH-315-E17]PCJ41492.1 MAG: peptidase M16 [SAR86 cluster bacterium]
MLPTNKLLLKSLFLTATCCVLLACSDSDNLDNEDSASTNTTSENSVSSALPAGVTLLERVEANNNELLISYSKFQLDNGLTIVIHEDHSDPIVKVDVTYHVGSAREEARRSGFAHFFEHMMFQGSEHVGDDEHFKIVTESGGTMNGSTSNDRTNYYQTVPSNQLETMLWLESDRMGFLLDAVTQEKFEIQRDTVKNERGQNVENSPYGRFNEINSSALYPPEHPYSWPTIGYPEDLDAATLDDLKNFFLRWYGPNNATLTIGGNVDETDVLNLVKQYFGEIPAGPEVLLDSQELITLDEDRYVSYVDENIRFPALLFTYPTVPLNHPDKVALEALNEVITGGRKSVFYKDFILTNKAIAATGFNNTMELAGSLTFYVMPFPGTPLSQFEEEIRAVLTNFNEDSISDEDLQIYKAQQEAGLINSLASVSGKVSQLAYYQTFYNNPNIIPEELEAIQNLTKDDILRVYNTYISGKAAVIQSIVPGDDPEGQAQPDNFTIPQQLSLLESANDNLEERIVVSAFDRSINPEAGPIPLVIMPEYWEASLDNGIDIIGALSNEIPTVNIRMSFDGGHLLESPEKYGLASLSADMMNEGTEQYSAEEFEIELDKLGSSISVSAGSQGTTISLRSLSRNLDATLDLLEERLFASVFTEDDLVRLRQQTIENIEASKEEPSSIAAGAYRKLIYGEGHPFAISSAGEIDTLENISLEDIQIFSRQSLVSQALDVVVIGDIEQEDILPKLNFLADIPNAGVVLPELPATPVITENTLYLIDKPQAPQSEIRIGYMGNLTYNPTGEYFERYLMNYTLGGAFSSRINLNLREDKGYTYGARSNFSATQYPGPFTASASVRADSTADSIVQFINEITQFRDQGITAEELAFTKNAIGQSEALDYETPGQKSRLLGQIIKYGLNRNFVNVQQEIINDLSIERVNELAREHLPVEEMILVVVGDKMLIEQSLIELGYNIVELDNEGQPL